MKRFTAVRGFLDALKEEDIAIFSSNETNKEAFQYDRDGNFYVFEEGLAPSLALGMAMATKKRVFMFCDDSELLREFGVTAQMSVSKCNNIIFVVFNRGYHEESGSPTIFKELYSPKGVLFNLGIVTHDLTHYFKTKKMLRELKNVVRGLKGPLCIMLNVDKGLKKGLNDVDILEEDLKNRMTGFMIS